MSRIEQLEEQRAWIGRLVERIGIHAVDEVSERLAKQVDATIKLFREEQAGRATRRKNLRPSRAAAGC